MDFHEYPKALYLGGDQDGDYRIVKDAEQEAAARDAGFRVIGEAGPAPADDAPTIESVRAKLDALGIDYDKRWGVSKLQALLPA